VFLTIHLLCGSVLDYIFGDPRFALHPARMIGLLCCFFEKQLRKTSPFLSLKISGIITFVLVCTSTLTAIWALFKIVEFLAQPAVSGAAVILLYFSIALGDLLKHSEHVYDHLIVGNIAAARSGVALMVGRDTIDMEPAAICGGCIESVSENLVDGVTAPLFWAVLCSSVMGFFQGDILLSAVCGAYLYKAVNTMDSMFGYKNEKYAEFGWFPARADDLFNCIPARMTGVCVIIAAFLIGFDYKQSAEVLQRDRLKTSSPNSGHTEAAFSGALGVRLGGTASYFGVAIAKPFIGEQFRLPEANDIKKANKLAITTTITFVTLLLLLYNLQFL